MGDADHDGDAPVDEFDGPADQRLALLETEICIFLSLDACCDDHGCAAVPHNIVDLTLQGRLVQLEIGRNRVKGATISPGLFIAIPLPAAATTSTRRTMTRPCMKRHS